MCRPLTGCSVGVVPHRVRPHQGITSTTRTRAGSSACLTTACTRWSSASTSKTNLRPPCRRCSRQSRRYVLSLYAGLGRVYAVLCRVRPSRRRGRRLLVLSFSKHVGTSLAPIELSISVVKIAEFRMLEMPHRKGRLQHRGKLYRVLCGS